MSALFRRLAFTRRQNNFVVHNNSLTRHFFLIPTSDEIMEDLVEKVEHSPLKPVFLCLGFVILFVCACLKKEFCLITWTSKKLIFK